MAQEQKTPQQTEEKKTQKNRTSSSSIFRIEPGRRAAVAKILVVGLLAVALFGVVINSYVQLNEVYTQISEALDLVRSENVRMQTLLEGQASIRNIKEYAEEELGMQQLNESQIQYLQIQTEDEVILAEQEQNIFVRIKHKFHDIIEYLRG